jgi:alpha-beta hydrolase superfamily lysophospholipase
MESNVSRHRRGWRIFRWLFSLSLLTILLVYTSLSILIAHVLTRSNNRPNTVDPLQIGPETVAWSTKTADGLTLRGWYCPTPEHRRLIVLVHGMGGNRDEMAAIGRDLHVQGYDVLLFDLRGHGTSDPSRLYMGGRERGDIRAVLAWASRQGFAQDRVGWLGWSMGAATLLMEGEQNSKIHAVVLDSPFSNLPELLDRQLTEHSHLPRLFNPGIILAARLAFGVRTDNLIPLRSALRWGGRPILLIHGEDDSIVPVSQARQIVGALGTTCQSMILPGVEHVGAYNESPERYIATVDRFFDHNLAH